MFQCRESWQFGYVEICSRKALSVERRNLYAAMHGHLHVLKWAKENGCNWDEFTCAKAAAGGYLEVLQWAREKNCPWDRFTCAYAAFFDHLDVTMGTRKQLSMGRIDLYLCSRTRTFTHF